MNNSSSKVCVENIGRYNSLVSYKLYAELSALTITSKIENRLNKRIPRLRKLKSTFSKSVVVVYCCCFLWSYLLNLRGRTACWEKQRAAGTRDWKEQNDKLDTPKSDYRERTGTERLVRVRVGANHNHYL